jgi:hypothetical protein
MSFRFIEDHRDAYPVRLMCAVLEVLPAGYHAWRDRPVSAPAASNAALLAAIRQVHQASSGRYGSPPASMPSCASRAVASAAAGSSG